VVFLACVHLALFLFYISVLDFFSRFRLVLNLCSLYCSCVDVLHHCVLCLVVNIICSHSRPTLPACCCTPIQLSLCLRIVQKSCVVVPLYTRVCNVSSPHRMHTVQCRTEDRAGSGGVVVGEQGGAGSRAPGGECGSNPPGSWSINAFGVMVKAFL